MTVPNGKPSCRQTTCASRVKSSSSPPKRPGQMRPQTPSRKSSTPPKCTSSHAAVGTAVPLRGTRRMSPSAGGVAGPSQPAPAHGPIMPQCATTCSAICSATCSAAQRIQQPPQCPLLCASMQNRSKYRKCTMQRSLAGAYPLLEGKAHACGITKGPTLTHCATIHSPETGAHTRQSFCELHCIT